MPINLVHYNHFVNLLPQRPFEQGPVGHTTARYVAVLNEVRQQQYEWPEKFPLKKKLNRKQVGEICRDPAVHPLIGYAAVMAWGGRGWRYPHYRNSLTGRSGDKSATILEQLRTSEADLIHDFSDMQQAVRKDAAEHIDNLGISFYTKLLYFFRPQPNAYILDTHLARSVSVLYDNCPVQLTVPDDLPHPQTTPETYGWFCRFIETMGRLLNHDITVEAFEQELQNGLNSAPPWTGEAVEMALFGSPGDNWREYVENNFDDDGDDDEEQPDQIPLEEPDEPRIPPRPILGMANDNDGNENQPWRQLARVIRDTHQAAMDVGRHLPRPRRDPALGERLHFGTHSCPRIMNHPRGQWVYYLQQGIVRVGVFFNNAAALRQVPGIPAIQALDIHHEFEFNGDKTLFIGAEVNQGYDAAPEHYQQIANEAIRIMERLRAIL